MSEEKKKTRFINSMKTDLAVMIGFFNHKNVFINIVLTLIFNLIALTAGAGLYAILSPSVKFHPYGLLITTAMLTVFELIIKYILFYTSFKGILKSGVKSYMYPIYLAIFFIARLLPWVYFYSFFSVLVFAIAFHFIKNLFIGAVLTVRFRNIDRGKLS